MNAKEMVHYALQIEKATTERSYGDILTLLADLDKQNVSVEQLEAADFVKVLYKLLKTCSDVDVKKTTKSLLSKWKKQYSRDIRGVKSTDESKEPETLNPRGIDEAGHGGASGQGESHSGSAQTGDSGGEIVVCGEQVASSLGVKDCPLTAENTSASFSSMRSKCVQLLLDSLCPEPPDHDKAAELARDIEHHVHQLHRANQVKYKSCVRSKFANLRNPKTKHLQRGLMSGSLSPEAFVRLSAEEMAGSELRQLREEISSRGVSERQLPQGVEGTPTHKIRCKNCGGSDCRVTQVSRGALFLPAWVRQGGPDDDAMTFVTCSGCGQQWYHSGWICL